MTVEDEYVELRQEIRELALTMVRLEQRAREIRGRNRWQRVADLDKARDLARERRSLLLHRVWLMRRDRYP